MSEPGALEVDVQGPEGVRVLQGDLGDELTGAQVAAALQSNRKPSAQITARRRGARSGPRLGTSGVDSVMYCS